jgi:hypothetical protein
MILLKIFNITRRALATVRLNLGATIRGCKPSRRRRHDDTKMRDYRFAACASRFESSGERFFISQFAIWRMFA